MRRQIRKNLKKDIAGKKESEADISRNKAFRCLAENNKQHISRTENDPEKNKETQKYVRHHYPSLAFIDICAPCDPGAYPEEQPHANPEQYPERRGLISSLPQEHTSGAKHTREN
jgi:hypothetical protein